MAGNEESPLEMSSTTLTSVDGGATMVHRVTERITADGRVELVVEGVGSSLGPAGISSLSKLIRWWARERAKLLKATAHRHATVTPLPPRGGPPPLMVPCGACDGEGWKDCSLCAGSGAVTEAAAEAWRIERYGEADA